MLLLSLAASLLSPTASGTSSPPSPGQIARSATAEEWVAIADEDLLVMDLSTVSGATNATARIVIQLMPAPIARGWVSNIRRLAAAHWWDNTSVNRVQDNYVAQWGDATEKKPLPPGLAAMSERDYDVDWAALPSAGDLPPNPLGGADRRPVDVYAAAIAWYRGFPVATDAPASADRRRAWPIHCYGSVGVGRNLFPDTGSGAELYAVIGHAPRHLDRNIAVVGRVIEGMEHLSGLPRGTGDLGFYERPDERVTISSIRLASDIPVARRPRFAYLSATGPTWPRYVEARRNREGPFFTRPAAAADVCNIPVPVKPLPPRGK